MMRASKFMIFILSCYIIVGILISILTGISNYSSGRTSYITSTRVDEFQDNQSAVILLYKKQCLACHQANGTGVPGMFPPLAGNEKISGSPADLIKIVLFGLKGPLTVNGRDYNQAMPAQGYLSDAQIADLLSYVRNSWGNKASRITPAAVAKIRKLGAVKN